MKTTRIILPFLILLLPFAANAQDQETAEVATTRPAATDTASSQLIKNFLAVTGGQQARINLRNVVATGTIKEGRKTKRFEMIETQDGKRMLTLTWRLLGREYKDVFAFDGVVAWKQIMLPKKQQVRDFGGLDGMHFINHRWFIQPMVLPLKAAYVFEYEGAEKVLGRPVHTIIGYGKQDERSWFCFDQETYLITRWGGIGKIANAKEHMDYQAIHFTKVDGVLLPKEITLLAEGKPYGNITVDTIEANVDIDSKIFYATPKVSPMLRQQSVQ
ncbi:MAG: hypothetical protein ACSHX8_06735 [Opitutaceae bacterium]